MFALAGIPIRGLADKMSDEEFFEFCQANDHIQMERDANGNIYIMSPVGSNSGNLEARIITFLELWNMESSKGRVFSSSTGFTLPDNSVRSPDTAWLSLEKWEQLCEEEKKGFAPVVPEFVVELRSESDDLRQLQQKMTEVWIANGVLLAWLIDPAEEIAYIYRAGGFTNMVKGFDQSLSGEDVLEGFEFELKNLII
jgi:Uma2 family endonuclease